MRATSRRLRRNSLGASSRSVCDWIRSRNSVSIGLLERQPKLLVAHVA